MGAAEAQKFQGELRKKISESRGAFGDDIDELDLANFLRKAYGGPGMLLVEPFTDMLLALKEKKLSGAPVAHNDVGQDWEIWSSWQSK